MKINLSFNIPDDTSGIDVQSFLASARFLLRGFFPESKLRVSIDSQKAPPCEPATPSSTAPSHH